MVPAVIVVLPNLPLSPAAEIDRRGLPAPVKRAAERRPSCSTAYITEEALAELWRQLLGIEQLGTNDHFGDWADLLVAMQMAAGFAACGASSCRFAPSWTPTIREDLPSMWTPSCSRQTAAGPAHRSRRRPGGRGAVAALPRPSIRPFDRQDYLCASWVACGSTRCFPASTGSQGGNSFLDRPLHVSISRTQFLGPTDASAHASQSTAGVVSAQAPRCGSGQEHTQRPCDATRSHRLVAHRRRNGPSHPGQRARQARSGRQSWQPAAS